MNSWDTEVQRVSADSALGTYTDSSKDHSSDVTDDRKCVQMQSFNGSNAETVDRFELLIEAVAEYAIFMLDPDGIVVSWNAGAERIKGYTADEIVGRHFAAFYTAEDLLARKPDHELAAAREHGNYRDEGLRVRKDGSTFWANVVITVIMDGGGHVQGYAKVTRDDTERRAASELTRKLELLRERDRIALGLHDSVTRKIFSASLRLQGAAAWAGDPTAIARIDDAIRDLEDTLKEIRSVVSDLYIERDT